jgi:DNA-binding PucR family transcriptional regulator
MLTGTLKMDTKPKTEALRKMLDEQIESFERRRRRDKKKALGFRIAQAVASAVVTVLLGLNVSQLGFRDVAQEWLKSLALVISAAATVFAAWDAFFDHRELWVRYTSAAAALKTLRSELNYRAAGPDPMTEADADKLFQRFQEILDQANTSWQQLRAGASPTRKTELLKPPQDPNP